MTSLTTMSATSSLMCTPGEERHAFPPAAQPAHLPASRVKPLAAIAAVVICVSLLGSIVVGLTAPASKPAAVAIADAGSVLP